MSDLRQQTKIRLTAAEPGATEKPVQKPVAATSFVRPTEGSSVSPALETFLVFSAPIALDALEGVLNTTGFEGVDDAPVGPLLNSGFSDVAAVELPAIPSPVLEVKPPATPIAVYEPIEFLDYEDEEDEIAVAAQIPEPEPDPPVLSEPLPLEMPKGAAPGVAKPQHGFAAVSIPDPAIEIPELALKTVRPRIVRGPDPNAPKPEPVVESKPVAPAAPKTTVVSKPSQPTIRPAAAPPPAPSQRPAAAAAAVAAAPAKAEPKTNVRPAPAVNRPVRDRGNAVPVEEVVEQAAPAPKPKMVPIRKPEPVAPEAAAAAAHDTPSLGLEVDRKSPMAKFGMIAVAAAVLAGGAFITFSGKSSSTGANGAEGATYDTASAGMVIGGGGWTTTWGSDTPTNEGKQISIYRPSMTMPDYRLEFRGQIERKALGWIFRARDPKNYYVMKLAAIKPGPNPVVALVKYAVINGKETTHTQTILPFRVSLDTLYQVRVDVKGDKFTTYVQGNALDYWTDDRIKVGGAGFYTDAGERSQIKSSQVSYLK